MSRYCFTYTEEHINWLKENYGTKPNKIIVKEFNKTFNTDIKENTLVCYVSNHKIPHILSCQRYYRYTIEMRNWIKENISKFNSYKELTDKLNELFNTNFNYERVRELCNKRLKIKLGKNISQYGNKLKEEYPIGTIKTGSNGVTYIKVKLANEEKMNKPNKGYMYPYWLPLQRYIYEKAYGKINKDEMIIFLDGNNQNYELDNLACVTRGLLAILNKFSYYGYGHATKAMIETLKTQKSLEEIYGKRYE